MVSSVQPELTSVHLISHGAPALKSRGFLRLFVLAKIFHVNDNRAHESRDSPLAAVVGVAVHLGIGGTAACPEVSGASAGEARGTLLSSEEKSEDGQSREVVSLFAERGAQRL